ncbi:Rha family transcriptional regulator [Enterococcus faecalis]|uniref:Rha family transcriptional regulator n=1 Tax=Enterococcus faecalis TaxID=1351 RepID=UPI002DBA6DDA|nr:Rha family transcriptional regulator [Enterococcus faecalis]MEB5927218.1 Rha family transcriptional regulator [Enterococcus faecalis]
MNENAKELVFLHSQYIEEEPYTTDEVIAKYSENKEDSVKRLIRTHKEDLEEFGKTTFEIRKPKKGSKGGRPKKTYLLNEEQATLLITYLDNTEPVRRFKKALVRQFYDMKNELYARRVERQKEKSVRKSMTDVIKELELSPHYYKHYTDLVYKTALGFNAKQLREAREVSKKSTILDFLTSEEIEAVNKREQQVATLLTLKMDYDTIKSILSGQGVLYQTTLKMPTKTN